MNDVALYSLEPYFRQFKEGLLFDFTPERYQSVDRENAKQAMINAVSAKPLKRPEIYEVVIPLFALGSCDDRRPQPDLVRRLRRNHVFRRDVR